jgi:hypothetical protein
MVPVQAPQPGGKPLLRLKNSGLRRLRMGCFPKFVSERAAMAHEPRRRGIGAAQAGLESGGRWNKMLATRVVRLGTAFVRTFKVNAPVGNRGANIVTVMTERSRTEKADGA